MAAILPHAPPPGTDARCVVGVPYVKDGTSVDGGDFAAMIGLDEFADTLFLFNDNVADGAERVLQVGAGNACIRPYASVEHDFHAVGIPTGWMKGVPFASLDCQVRQVINIAVERAIAVYHKFGYTRVVFSCAEHNRKELGTSTFDLPSDVLSFLNKNLARLEGRLADPGKGLSLPQLEWAAKWVPYRLEEEQRKRAQRFSLQATAFGHGRGLLTSPTGLVKRARAATEPHGPVRPPNSIARFF